jgi:hypothetical protein
MKKDKEFKVEACPLPGLGYLQAKLPLEVLQFLSEATKNKTKKYNDKLVGNIGSSYLIPDKDDWFYKTILQQYILTYVKHFGTSVFQPYLTKNCNYVLQSMWVNYQKKYEFNPIHDHSGIFSFVVWCKIPSSHQQEKNLSFVKHSANPSASCFEFIYNDTVARLRTKKFYLSPEDEGTMLFFPSTLMHQVYPFYTSDEERVTIAGNIAIDPEQIVK